MMKIPGQEDKPKVEDELEGYTFKDVEDEFSLGYIRSLTTKLKETMKTTLSRCNEIFNAVAWDYNKAKEWDQEDDDDIILQQPQYWYDSDSETMSASGTSSTGTITPTQTSNEYSDSDTYPSSLSDSNCSVGPYNSPDTEHETNLSTPVDARNVTRALEDILKELDDFNSRHPTKPARPVRNVGKPITYSEVRRRKR